jgi:hypothetical protein
MSLSLQGIQKSTNSVGTSQKVSSAIFLGMLLCLFCYQRLPNNISIKIDTTQEYVRDEVSVHSSGAADLVLIRTYDSTHLQRRISKADRRFNRFFVYGCHEVEKQHNVPTVLSVEYRHSFLHWFVLYYMTCAGVVFGRTTDTLTLFRTYTCLPGVHISSEQFGSRIFSNTRDD